MGIQSFKDFLTGQKVQVVSDNMTTVAFLQQMEGFQKELDSLVRAIRVLAIDLKIKFKGKLVSGKMNWRADQLSRVNSTYEWILHPNLFQTIEQHWGPHEIDLFASMLKPNVLRPIYVGSRCTNRLDQFKQLCERSVCFTEQCVRLNTQPKDIRNSDSAVLVRADLVSKSTNYGYRRINQTSSVKPNSYCGRSESGILKEQGMGNLCLENLWRSRLRCLHGRRTRTISSIVESTFRTYDNCINKYIIFCMDQRVDVSNKDHISVLSKCLLTKASQGPESMWKTALSAVACLFEALGKVSPTNNSDIKAFSRFAPMCRSKPLPIQSFIHSFAVWRDNSVICESAKVKDNNIFSPDLYYTAIRFVIIGC